MLQVFGRRNGSRVSSSGLATNQEVRLEESGALPVSSQQSPTPRRCANHRQHCAVHKTRQRDILLCVRESVWLFDYTSVHNYRKWQLLSASKHEFVWKAPQIKFVGSDLQVEVTLPTSKISTQRVEFKLLDWLNFFAYFTVLTLTDSRT